ncbi:emerin isoform X1 [Bufo bufo]|uniref:emerin isoform X1 n=1 Tax=Bufo bufo TaxID=8384 RepID=UPI001ABDE020|nr:emerin isoform X1 [Bufo bufo]
MEKLKLKNMTDEELISTLRKYGIQHGPILGTTRTLYEKKLLQYEREKTKFPASTSSYTSRQQYSGRDFDDDSDSYGSRQRKRDVDDDNGDSHTYEEEVTRTYHYPQTSYRSYSSNDNVYQNISQPRYQSSYSQGVEPRKPIRPKQKEETTPVKRLIPIWLQLLMLLLFSAFLVYMYLLQTEENPFRLVEGSL